MSAAMGLTMRYYDKPTRLAEGNRKRKDDCMLPESTWELQDGRLAGIIARIDERRTNTQERLNQLYEKDSALHHLSEERKLCEASSANDDITFCSVLLRQMALLLGAKNEVDLLDAVRRWKADVYDAEHQPGVEQFDVFLGDLELPKLKDYIRPDVPEKQD